MGNFPGGVPLRVALRRPLEDDERLLADICSHAYAPWVTLAWLCALEKDRRK